MRTTPIPNPLPGPSPRIRYWRVSRASHKAPRPPKPHNLSHEPLLQDTRRASNKCLSCSTVRHNYLLKGLMRCQECGSLMYSKSCHGTSYYVCGKKRNSFPDDAPCGNTRHFRGEPLDEAIWTEFRRIILSPDVLLDRVRHRALDGAGEKQAVEI